MRIETIALENIRSHVDTVANFSRGFNCLVGGVGCGKSSILYAIDFALFGDPLGRSYGYLLREGASDSKVTLAFIHNGKKYIMQRGLKKKGKNIGQDLEQLKLLEGEKLVAEGKNEAVAEQLKAITGLDRDLFREIVWVRQEHLKELLDATSRERQKRLDELFGLSDYETAWSSLASIQKEYETEQKVYETDYDVIGVEKLHSDYMKAAEEFTKLEDNLQTTRKEIVKKEVQLKEAEAQLQSLEELRQQTEQLQRKETELKTTIANNEAYYNRLKEQTQTRKKRLEELENRRKTCEEKMETNRSQLTDAEIRSDQTLDELKTYIETIEVQIASLMGENEATKREIQITQRRFDGIAKENKCPLCLQDLTAEYKQSLQERLEKESKEKRETLTNLNKKLEELEQHRNKVYSAYSNMQALMPQLDALKAQIADAKETLKSQTEDHENKQQEKERLKIQLEKIQIEISKFDTATLETAKKQRDTVLQQYLPLRKEIEMMEQRKTDIANKIDDLQKRIEEAEKKKTRMQKIAKILEVTGGIREAYRAIQPKLRSEFVKILEKMIQHILDQLAGEEPTLTVTIDETYTPYVRSEGRYEREVANLSGGERTLLAFAYRLGLGQLIIQSRTGHSLHMLLLDEPTESLGREDGSIDRLAEAISRIKTIEQIIAVTHSEAFAEKAEHVIRVEKEAEASKIISEQQSKLT